jgi:hypothetical protein
MASLTQQQPGVTPAPTVPEMTNAPNGLAGYLSRFALWATANFNNSMMKRTATSEIYLQSPGGYVYLLAITDAGSLTATPIILGGTAGPAGPPLTFTPT